MCGIFGFIGNKTPAKKTLQLVAARAAERGPDGFGLAFKSCQRVEVTYGDGSLLDSMNTLDIGLESKAILGHCRLPTQGGRNARHPFKCGDGWLVHNGNVYSPEKYGHLITSGCDTEAVAAEIAQKGPAAIKAFSTAIDNSLGQPTQSQFILVAENWDRVSQTIGHVVTSTADFSNAVDVASDKIQISLDRIGIGFTNFLSVIGSGDALGRFFTNIGAALQNVYDRARTQEAGFTNITGYNQWQSDVPGISYATNTVFDAVRKSMEDPLERA
jgi:predicted glutamine amidotransferase